MLSNHVLQIGDFCGCGILVNHNSYA